MMLKNENRYMVRVELFKLKKYHTTPSTKQLYILYSNGGGGRVDGSSIKLWVCGGADDNIIIFYNIVLSTYLLLKMMRGEMND